MRRQREDWQRDATRDLATGKTGAAIHAYDRSGMVQFAGMHVPLLLGPTGSETRLAARPTLREGRTRPGARAMVDL